MSKGERIISSWLNSNNIDFEKEFVVHIEGHRLRFDFYIPSIDKFIEFQGEGHFKVVDIWGGEEGFEKRKKYDNLKKKYYGNKIIEITYKEMNNINDILNSLFNDYPEREYTVS